MIAYLGACMLSVALIAAAIFDLATMTIPNRLTLALAAAFVALGPLMLPWQEYVLHLSAGGAMLVLAMGLFALGWIGGGDAKLFAATALWFGWNDLPAYALVAAVAGGVLTLGLLAARRSALAMLPVLEQPWIVRLMRPRGDVPYGVALAAGALLVLPHSALMSAAAG